MPGFPDTQNVYEYCVAAAQKQMVYPGIQQCISITGFSVFGLLGTHVSPGATADEIDKTLEILKTGGGANYPNWYIVGNFSNFFNYTQVGWNSFAKIASALRKNLSKKATYLVFDTSDISNSVGSWGIDILATRNTFGVDFAYAKGSGPSPKPTTAITADFSRA